MTAPTSARGDRFRLAGWLAAAAVMGVLAVGGNRIGLLIVGVGLALGAAWLLADRPERATWIVLALVYSNAIVVGVTHHGLPAIAAAAVPALLAVSLVDNLVRRRPIIIPPPSYWMLAFAAAMFLSAASSADVTRSFAEVQVFVTEGIGIYFGIVNVIRTRNQLVTATHVVVMTAAALASLSIFQWLTRSYDSDFFGFAQLSDARIRLADGGDGQPRIAGPVGEKNRYAQVLAVVVPLAAACAWTATRRIGRQLWWIAAGAILVAVALTYSRGAAVGMVPILLLAAVMQRVRLRSIVAGSLVVVLLVLAVPGYRDRLASLEAVGGATAAAGDQGETDGAIRGRVTQNLAAALVFVDHPVLGVGPDMFPTYYPSYAADIGIRPRLIEREAHNLWLDIAADTGLFGLTAFLGLVLSVSRRLWQRHRLGDRLAGGYLLAVLAYQTTGVFLHLSYARYYWLLMALATVAAVVGDDRSVDLDERELVRT